jgi:hypothetical protein
VFHVVKRKGTRDPVEHAIANREAVPEVTTDVPRFWSAFCGIPQHLGAAVESDDLRAALQQLG